MATPNPARRYSKTTVLTEATPLCDGDAVVHPEVYREKADNPIALAVDGFARFLGRLHGGKVNAKSFVRRGYAAAWHLSPQSLGGISQGELARKLGMSKDGFSKQVAAWQREVGFVGSGTRPTAATRARLARR